MLSIIPKRILSPDDKTIGRSLAIRSFKEIPSLRNVPNFDFLSMSFKNILVLLFKTYKCKQCSKKNLKY